MPQSLKQCTKCSKWKLACKFNFHRDPHARDNLRTQCAPCQQQYNHERKEKYSDMRREYRQATKGVVPQYYEKHQERMNAYRREWRDANKERERAKERVRRAKRRAIQLAVGGTHTATDIRNQYEKQGGKCLYCGCAVGDKYHVDHYIPLAKGGGNDAANIVIACPTCNMSKKDLLPDEFLARKQG